MSRAPSMDRLGGGIFSGDSFSDDFIRESKDFFDTPTEGPATEEDMAFGSDSDSEGVWDEVDVSRGEPHAVTERHGDVQKEIRIVIPREKDVENEKRLERQRKYEDMRRERTLRLLTHRVHVMSLLGVGMIRNKWANDPELQARVLSMTPLRLQRALTSFNRLTHPNDRERSRLFDAAIRALVDFWNGFFDVDDDGTVLARREAFQVSQELSAVSDFLSNLRGGGEASDSSLEVVETNPLETYLFRENGKLLSEKARHQYDVPKDVKRVVRHLAGHEYLKSGIRSVMKHALLHEGSQQMSVLLFLALLRGLGVPARFVMSLQPVNHKRPKETKPVRKAFSSSSRNQAPRIYTNSTGTSYTVPSIRLRHTKSVARRESIPPFTWIEVYSRVNRHWITVDVINNRIRCTRSMEPPKSCRTNEMLYVVAYEEDLSVRDVSLRYSSRTETELRRARAPNRPGEDDWFAALLLPYERKFELNRDREEQAEFAIKRRREPMPSSLAGFKNHPRYVLERDIKREEALAEDARPLGIFGGNEKIYDRSRVLAVKSSENYWRMGRVIKAGERPLKFVKARVTTINKLRAREVEKLMKEEDVSIEGSDNEETQGMYSFDQTELYIPPPVIDGRIPKNRFGNIDLYVDTMLPKGAVHIDNEYAAKCAKALGVDYADAITGFLFRNRRATPVIKGIVATVDNAGAIIDAAEEMEKAEDIKAKQKEEDKALALWRKFIVALRVRQRLQSSYTDLEVKLPLNIENGEEKVQLVREIEENPEEGHKRARENSPVSQAKEESTFKVKLRRTGQPMYNMEQSSENPTRLKLTFKNQIEEEEEAGEEGEGSESYASSLEFESDF